MLCLAPVSLSASLLISRVNMLLLWPPLDKDPSDVVFKDDNVIRLVEASV